MGISLNVQTFQEEQYYTLKPMDKIYWLPVLSPTHWEARHCGCASEQAGGYRETICSSCTLFARSTRSSRLQRGTPFNDFPKAGIVQIGGPFGADVSYSKSFPVNILNLAEKILGAIGDDQKRALLRFRMVDKDDLESFIRSTVSADFFTEKGHAAVKKIVDAVDEVEQPDRIEVKTHFENLKNHS